MWPVRAAAPADEQFSVLQFLWCRTVPEGFCCLGRFGGNVLGFGELASAPELVGERTGLTQTTMPLVRDHESSVAPGWRLDRVGSLGGHLRLMTAR